MGSSSEKKDIDEFFVPWVRDAKAYSSDHITYAWKHPSTDRLMANENFHSPSKKVIKAVTDTARKGNLYPPESSPLKERLAKLNGLEKDNVFVGNGSLEVIDVIARVFISPGDEVITPLPSYAVYGVRTKLVGGSVRTVPPLHDLTCDVNSVIKMINKKTRLIIIVSPNNPIGSIFPENDLRTILDEGVPTVVDEAYYELEDNPQSVSVLLEEYPNLIVIRTMSKAWGMAGYRIGYAFASEKIIDHLNRMRINFSISIVNMAAAIAALDDIEYFNKQNADTKKLRSELEKELKKIKGLRVFHSSGNFILMDGEELGVKGEDVVKYCLENNIQIRLMNKPELGAGFFRITIGSREQHKRFVRTLKEFLSNK